MVTPSSGFCVGFTRSCGGDEDVGNNDAVLAAESIPSLHSCVGYGQLRGCGCLWALIHRVSAVVIALYCFLHFVYIIYYLLRRRGSIFRGPSMLPHPRDVVGLWQHLLYFVGRRPRPKFDRFTYWEKFDYWAVFWGVLIIGLSGLVLWFPEIATRFLPGIAINIAHIMHSDEAVLAVGFIFVVHMFNTHLRAEKFPVDTSIFTGKVSEEELQEEHALEWERMQEDPSLMDETRVK